MNGNRFIDFLQDHARAIYLIFLGFAFAGWLAYCNLPSDVYPNLTFPRIAVIATTGDTAPELGLLATTRILEGAASQVYHVSSVRSKTIRGSSEISVNFENGTDLTMALHQLQARVAEVQTQLPPSVAVTIEPVTPAIFPVLSFNVTTEALTYADLHTICRYQLVPALSRVPGVARVQIQGGDIAEIAVQVDPDKIKSYHLSVSTIADALSKLNQLQVVGRLNEAHQQNLLVASSEAVDLPALSRTVVATLGTKPVYLSDVAEISLGIKDRTSLVSVHQKKAVVLNIFKQPSSNVVALAMAVKKEVSKLLPSMPEGLSVEPAYDESALVRSSLANVTEAILIGMALIVVVLLAFLRSWKSTLIAALSIPLSALAAFVCLLLCGQSLNLMSLGGLAIAIGLVIDDAIVVIENISRQLSHTNAVPQAVRQALKELAGPVTSSTVTTVVVFIPLGLLSGVTGQFFTSLTVTLSAAVVFSWLLALTLMPLLAGALLSGGKKTEKHYAAGSYLAESRAHQIVETAGSEKIAAVDSERVEVAESEKIAAVDSEKGEAAEREKIAAVDSERVEAADSKKIESADGQKGEAVDAERIGTVPRGIYPATLRFFLNQAWLVVLVVGSISYAAVYLYPRLTSDFLPAVDEASYVLDYLAPPGTALADMDQLADKLEAVVSKTPEVVTWTRRSGSELGLFATQTNKGDVLVVLKPSSQRKRTVEAIMDEQRAKINESLPQLDVDFHQILQDELNDLSGAPRPIEVRIYGEDPFVLRTWAQRIKEKIGEIPGLVDLTSTGQLSAPQDDLQVDALAAGRHGLNTADVIKQVQDSLIGRQTSQMRVSDRLLPIRVRLNDILRQSPQALTEVPIFGTGGSSLPLSALATVVRRPAESEIQCENQLRYVSVEAELDKSDLGSAIKQIEGRLKPLETELPRGYRFEVAGLYASQQQSFRELFSVLLLSATLVYLVLVMQFRSLLQPLAILLSVPLGIFGVELALYLTGTTINVSSFMGVILLVGLSVKNGIILLDCANQYRAGGLSLDQAIIKAASVRLRPIMMTTICTILGLIPLAVGLGSGAELQKPLAIAVIGGLVFSTAFTLFFVPTVYKLLHGGRG